MSGAGFLRLKKLKGKSIIAAAARHNRRAIQAEVGASASIDATRSSLNETLQGPHTADGVAQLASLRIREAGVGKLRKDAVMAIEIIFSLPKDSGLDDRRYFMDCASWAALNFGGPENVLSVDVHRDEAAPHCHVLILPLVNGKMVGSDMVGNRHRLLEMQLDFHRAVAARYGLRKAPARLAGATKQQAASMVLGSLQRAADGALRSQVWSTIRDTIERDPAPYVMALGIELDAPKKTLRTMTQIFTSTGKGRKNPIGFEGRSAPRTLCTVGVAPTPTPTPALQVCVETEITRERECNLDPTTYDPETGEFHQAPHRPVSVKAAAAAWVSSALAGKQAKA